MDEFSDHQTGPPREDLNLNIDPTLSDYTGEEGYEESRGTSTSKADRLNQLRGSSPSAPEQEEPPSKKHKTFSNNNNNNDHNKDVEDRDRHGKDTDFEVRFLISSKVSYYKIPMSACL
jgi:hypothetical protein